MSKFKLHGENLDPEKPQQKILWDPILRFKPEGAVHDMEFCFGCICGKQKEPSVGFNIGPGGMVLTQKQVEDLAHYMLAASQVMNGKAGDLEIMNTELVDHKLQTVRAV